MVFELFGKLLTKKVDLSWDEFKEILISHHPNCKEFDSDVIVISGHRVCEGCLLSYSAAIIGGILILLSGKLLNPTSAITLLFALFLFGFVKKITDNRLAARIGKILIGLCIPLTIYIFTQISDLFIKTIFVILIFIMMLFYS